MRLPLYSTGETQGPGNCTYCNLLLKQQSPGRASRFCKAATAMPPSAVHDCSFPSTPGKVKMERSNYFGRVASRWQSFGPGKIVFWCVALLALLVVAVFFYATSPGVHNSFEQSLSLREAKNDVVSWGGSVWEKHVRHSAHAKRENGLVVLVTGAAGFVGTHVSLALKKRGDGVIGLDNFNSYYDPFLKRARQGLLEKQGVFVVEGDINNIALLRKLFDVITFTHVMHLAAQAGVRYAMENPGSYVHSNIAGFVNLLEACKEASPQPAIVWASSSSVYGLNSKVPFSEIDRTDQPASLYAATKKAGEEIAHTYNHIYGLSITGLRFFTVYGPWGRPDMAYFFFTKAILQGKPVNIYQGPNQVDLARDFTYIDDIVKGCFGALDTATPSTGTGGKKRGPAQLRVYNLGNTSPVTVPTLVAILEKHLKVKAKRNVVRMPRNGDVPFTHANVTLARVELGYNPTTDLQTGLKKFVKWYQLYYGGGSSSSSSSSSKRRLRP
ncbi:UDP-glucuronate 4-epimerase 3 [Selaginella moellendorffii]|nr:UDP-glucuronate 4-epimerase 3 [Selaginella moellendorffii]|eukprot:XP_002993206.2 UDP-glucuronate 4-epimerase 3 [Selaginella moellendorffii]